MVVVEGAGPEERAVVDAEINKNAEAVRQGADESGEPVRHILESGVGVEYRIGNIEQEPEGQIDNYDVQQILRLVRGNEEAAYAEVCAEHIIGYVNGDEHDRCEREAEQDRAEEVLEGGHSGGCEGIAEVSAAFPVGHPAHEIVKNEHHQREESAA